MPRVTRPEPQRPSRLKLLLRRQRYLVRPLLLLLTGFGIVLAGTVLMHSAQRGGTVAKLQQSLARALDLRVRRVVVTGRNNTPAPVLDAALGIAPGDPILDFSVSDARNRIEGLSWVQHAAVERQLPDRIVVAIEERRPFAIWQSEGRFQLIDRAGGIVTDEDVARFPDLPLVVGQGAPPVAAALLDTLKTLPDVGDRVVAAVRVGQRRWNLQLKNGVVVMLPEEDEPAALARLHDLQSQQSLLDRPLVFVDLRLPDRLVVRAHPPAPPLDSTVPVTLKPAAAAPGRKAT